MASRSSIARSDGFCPPKTLRNRESSPPDASEAGCELRRLCAGREPEALRLPGLLRPWVLRPLPAACRLFPAPGLPEGGLPLPTVS